MANALSVFLAGGLGCFCRYLVGLYIFPILGFPVATLVVNICGGFLAGVVATKWPHLKPLLLVGFLGGFTTFSAFSLECLTMLQNQQIFTMLIYIIISMCFSICAAWVGYIISV
jgi:CrcB protein